MDWLRIGAFGLLILYHIGMVFSPWHWVVKAARTYPALIAPMALLTPWRLALLFAVSGFASRHLLERSASVAAFLRERARRLLVPLAFGMAALVPAEMWVRVVQAGYPGGFLHFWSHDYWRVGLFWGREFPSWEHLWFVAYLAAYTGVLGVVVGAGARAERLVAWMEPRGRLLWAPIAALATAKLLVMFVAPERQGLLTDWGGHAEYAPLFAWGFILAGWPRLWRTLAVLFPAAVATAAAAGLVAVVVELRWPADAVPPHAVMALDRAARIAMAWAMTLALFHAANRWWNRDSRLRAPLARAVFPAYLLHHPALVLAAWWTLPLGLPAPVEFALLAAVTLVACAGGYALGRVVPPLGVLIGLPRRLPQRVEFPSWARNDQR